MNGDEVCRKIRELLAKTPGTRESKLNAFEDIRWLMDEWDENAHKAEMDALQASYEDTMYPRDLED